MKRGEAGLGCVYMWRRRGGKTGVCVLVSKTTTDCAWGAVCYICNSDRGENTRNSSAGDVFKKRTDD